MINSFNIITGRVSFETVINSGVGLFAHTPDEDIDIDTLDAIIQYFEEREMYEHCAELHTYLLNNYDDDGVLIEEICVCDYPSLGEYKLNMLCLGCKKKIKR
jgi:hypothetical protein